MGKSSRVFSQILSFDQDITEARKSAHHQLFVEGFCGAKLVMDMEDKIPSLFHKLQQLGPRAMVKSPHNSPWEALVVIIDLVKAG